MPPLPIRIARRFGLAKSPPRRRISDSFPDVALTNQFGTALQFRRDFIDDGRALVVNSMYTRCRGTCPGTSAQINRLRDRMSPIFGSRLTFISFTLEPELDRPADLLAYGSLYGADKFEADRCDWHFVTGEKTEIEALRRALGFFDLNPRVDQDVTQHASLLLVGNATTDRWMAMPAELRSVVLVESIRRVAGFTMQQKFGIPG